MDQNGDHEVIEIDDDDEDDDATDRRGGQMEIEVINLESDDDDAAEDQVVPGVSAASAEADDNMDDNIQFLGYGPSNLEAPRSPRNRMVKKRRSSTAMTTSLSSLPTSPMSSVQEQNMHESCFKPSSTAATKASICSIKDDHVAQLVVDTTNTEKTVFWETIREGDRSFTSSPATTVSMAAAQSSEHVSLVVSPEVCFTLPKHTLRSTSSPCFNHPESSSPQDKHDQPSTSSSTSATTTATTSPKTATAAITTVDSDDPDATIIDSLYSKCGGELDDDTIKMFGHKQHQVDDVTMLPEVFDLPKQQQQQPQQSSLFSLSNDDQNLPGPSWAENGATTDHGTGQPSCTSTETPNSRRRTAKGVVMDLDATIIIDSASYANYESIGTQSRNSNSSDVILPPKRRATLLRSQSEISSSNTSSSSSWSEDDDKENDKDEANSSRLDTSTDYIPPSSSSTSGTASSPTPNKNTPHRRRRRRKRIVLRSPNRRRAKVRPSLKSNQQQQQQAEHDLSELLTISEPLPPIPTYPARAPPAQSSVLDVTATESQFATLDGSKHRRPPSYLLQSLSQQKFEAEFNDSEVILASLKTMCNTKKMVSCKQSRPASTGSAITGLNQNINKSLNNASIVGSSLMEATSSTCATPTTSFLNRPRRSTKRITLSSRRDPHDDASRLDSLDEL